MSRERLSSTDKTRIKNVIDTLSEETLCWYNDPIRMVNIFGFAHVPVGESGKTFSTEEGLLTQVDTFSAPIGLVYFLTNDRILDKMAIKLEENE